MAPELAADAAPSQRRRAVTRTEAACTGRESGESNEDYVAVALTGDTGAFVLVDGVSGADAGCIHGVPWYVARLGGELLTLASTRHGTDLRGCLAAAISVTADRHRATCDLTPAYTPQSTVVVARWLADRCEYLVLSDSTLLLQRRDGALTVVTDRLGSRLSEDVLSRFGAMLRARDALPGGSAERAAAHHAYLAASSRLRNAEGGFFTAAADPSVADRALTGAVPRSDVRALAAVTDGAGKWVDVFGLGDWRACMDLLRDGGPRTVIAQVRAAEAVQTRQGSEAECGKPTDDASAVFVEFPLRAADVR